MGQAADLYAGLIRSQWETYKQTGYPLENAQLSMYKNNSTLNSNLAAATGLAKTAGQVSASETNRSMASYGIAPTQAQVATNARLNNLTTSVNMANARDAVRSNTQELDRQILVGGAPNDGLTVV
jgi:hypothetical protein